VTRERAAILAVEDVVSQAVGAVVCAACGIEVANVVGLRGKGYLKAKADGLNRAAAGFPVIMLVDQDRTADCPPTLLSVWFSVPLTPSFHFCVSVMEVESWLLADRAAISSFLGVHPTKVPDRPDRLPSPKETIVSLARKSRRKTIRQDLVPADGSTAAVGPLYNPRLVDWVTGCWCPRRAAKNSESLARTLLKLEA
jgi:hypothetical protein